MVLLPFLLREPAQEEPTVPGEFLVTLKRKSKADLGCVLVHVPGKALLVAGINSDGIIWAWNREHPDRQVRLGDRIVEVDGICRDSHRMLRRINQGRSSLQLRVQPRTDEDIQILHRRLQTRELTPEDFELLTLLDESIRRKAKSEAEDKLVDSLPRVQACKCEVDECAVCLSDFEADSSITQLPCGHCYCTPCISHWLKDCKRHCPLCMKTIDLSEVGEKSTCESSSEAPCEFSTPSESGDIDASDLDEGYRMGPVRGSAGFSVTRCQIKRCQPVTRTSLSI